MQGMCGFSVNYPMTATGVAGDDIPSSKTLYDSVERGVPLHSPRSTLS